MRRRKFLALTGSSLAVGLPALAKVLTPTFETVITGGNVLIDGNWKQVHLGVRSDGNLEVLQNLPTGIPVLDVKGKYVAPGFIDLLADNAANPERTFRIFEKYKVTDGVTSALQMHGGSAKVADYYKHFGSLPHRINFGVSVFVMRIRYAKSSVSERLKLVEQNLEAGALGVSHSIEYQPTPYEEVLQYARLAKKYDRPLFLHLRYSSEAKELDGVDEAIDIGKNSGARVHIDHLHSTGGTFHMEGALEKIRSANRSGIRITCCVYPYSFWATYLHSKRFDEGWRERYGLDYNDLRLVGTGERLTAESFARYKKLMKLVAVPEGTMSMEKTIDLALKEDFCMIGSDGGIEYEPNANSHPRGAGCFATAVRHGLDIGMPLEKIIAKITAIPRGVLLPAMNDRGAILNGYKADLVVFDPQKINGRASVENPNQFSDGISMVLVNGKLAYKEGVLGVQAGVPIKY